MQLNHLESEEFKDDYLLLCRKDNAKVSLYMQSYSTIDVIDSCDSRDSYVFEKFINAAIYVEKTIKKMAPDLQNYEKNLAETIKIMKTKRKDSAKVSLYMQSYSTIDVIDSRDSRDSYVFKKFINAAIYVEKTIKKIAPDLQNYERNLAETIKIMKTKRCSCYIDADSCPCHPTMASGDGLKGTKSETRVNSKDFDFLGNLEKLMDMNENTKKTIKKRPMQTKVTKQPNLPHKVGPSYRLHLSKLDDAISHKAVPSETKLVHNKNQMNSTLPDEITGNVLNVKEHVKVELAPKTQTICESYIKNQCSDNDKSSTTSSSSTLSTCSQITVIRSDKAFMCETKAKSLTSFKPSENNSVRQWLSKKMEEQKKKQLTQREQERKKQMEREKILEKERENFKMWLAKKRRTRKRRKLK